MSSVVHPPAISTPTKLTVRSVAPARSFGLSYIVWVPLLAGVATIRGVEIAGFNYSGVLWVGVFAIGVLLLLDHFTSRPRPAIAFPVALWLPWLVFATLSLLWLDEPGYLQVQSALQLGMPILIGVLAAVIVRTRLQLERLVRAYFVAMWLLVLAVGLSFVSVLSRNEEDPVYVSVRVVSLTAVVIGGLFMAGSSRRFGASWFGWAVCLTISVVTGSRMASLALLALPILNPVNRNVFFKTTAVTVALLVAAGIASTTMFQERFFYGRSGDLSEIASGDFDTAGRFDAWPLVLKEALKRPWLGHGVGSVQLFLPRVWTEVVHPHNDYLRLLYELGGVGLALFLVTVFWQLWALRRTVHRTSGVVQQAFGAAYLGLAAFLLIAVTDNPIVYHVWYMNPVFAPWAQRAAWHGRSSAIASWPPQARR